MRQEIGDLVRLEIVDWRIDETGDVMRLQNSKDWRLENADMTSLETGDSTLHKTKDWRLEGGPKP